MAIKSNVQIEENIHQKWERHIQRDEYEQNIQGGETLKLLTYEMKNENYRWEEIKSSLDEILQLKKSKDWAESPKRSARKSNNEPRPSRASDRLVERVRHACGASKAGEERTWGCDFTKIIRSSSRSLSSCSTMNFVARTPA